MRIVLRYELTDFLKFVNMKGYVVSSTNEYAIPCKAVLMIDGKYAPLIEHTAYVGYYENGVAYVTDEPLLVDIDINDIENMSVKYNERLYRDGETYGFIDEIYTFESDVPVGSLIEKEDELGKLVKTIREPENDIELIENLLDQYDTYYY